MSTVLLLHGALGSKTQLNPLKTILETRGMKVYSLNFSGHSGEPFRQNFGIEEFADDVFRFLENRKLGPVNIFGYSMGGYVALWLAHQRPKAVEKIITLGTKFDWTAESAAREVRKLDPEKILEKVPAFARILEQRHLPNNWKELLHKSSAMMTLLGEKVLLTDEVLKTIQHETYILLGDKDDMADHDYSRKIAEILPRGRFASLENTTHPIERVNLEILQQIIVEEFK